MRMSYVVPSWLANVQHLGPTIVDILAVTNANNRDLWEPAYTSYQMNENGFYVMAQTLADAWTKGIDVRGAIFHYQFGGTATLYEHPAFYCWAIPAGNDHDMQVLLSNKTYFLVTGGLGLYIYEGQLLVSPDDTPRMRDGFFLSPTATGATFACGNTGLLLWTVTTAPPPPPPPPPTPVLQHAFCQLDMILYPTPWRQWDQSWDMDALVQKTVQKTQSMNAILRATFEISQTISAIFQKSFTKTYVIDALIRNDLEKSMIMSLHVQKNAEIGNDMSAHVVLWPEQPYDMSMILLKNVEFIHHMYANIKQENEDFAQTMDVRLIKVPKRRWIIPQFWDLQTREELDSDSTGDVFDSRNTTDRLREGGV